MFGTKDISTSSASRCTHKGKYGTFVDLPDITMNYRFGCDGFQTSFECWWSERPELATMIAEGKDRIEWSRTVDAAKLGAVQITLQCGSPGLTNYKWVLRKMVWHPHGQFPPKIIQNFQK